MNHHPLLRYATDMETGIKRAVAELGKRELRKARDELTPIATTGFRRLVLLAIEERLIGPDIHLPTPGRRRVLRLRPRMARRRLDVRAPVLWHHRLRKLQRRLGTVCAVRGGLVLAGARRRRRGGASLPRLRQASL